MCGGCVIFPGQVITPERAATIEADARARTVAELEGIDNRAKDAAFSLFTLATFSVNADALNAVVSELFAIAGLIPAIHALLLVDDPSPVVTSGQNTLLFQYVLEIRALLEAVDKKIEATGEWIYPLGRVKEPEGGFYPLHDLQKASRLLKACFSSFTVIITAARWKGLEEITQSPYQALESLRLREALARPQYKVTPLPLVSPSPPNSPSPPTQPSPSTSAYRRFEPSVPDFQLTVENEPASATATATATPVMTPSSSRDGTPTAGSDKPASKPFSFNEPFNTTTNAKAKIANTSARPNIFGFNAPPPAPDPCSFGPPARTSPTNTLSVDDPSNLHMYLLRPVVEAPTVVNNILRLTYQISSIPVPRSEIMSHLQILPPNYSVVKALEELYPEELRLVLDHVNEQNGTIISLLETRSPRFLQSLQQTDDLERLTPMGTLKLRSFYFVVTTSATPTTSQPAPTAPPAPPAPQQGTSTASIFKNWPTFNVNGFHSHGSDRPEPIKEKEQLSDPAFVPFEEKDYAAGRTVYQTITANPLYRNYSLEELRLLDYQAGRKGSNTHNPFKAAADAGRPQSDFKAVLAHSNTLPRRQLNNSQPFGKSEAQPESSSNSARSLFEASKTASAQHSCLFGHFGPSPNVNNTSTTVGPSSTNSGRTFNVFPPQPSLNNTSNTGSPLNTNAIRPPSLFAAAKEKETLIPNAAPSLFGVRPQQNAPTKPSNLFGAAPQQNTPRTGGLFDRIPPTSSGKAPEKNAPTTGGLFNSNRLFGNVKLSGTASSPSTSTSAGTAASTSCLFGAARTQVTTGGSSSGVDSAAAKFGGLSLMNQGESSKASKEKQSPPKASTSKEPEKPEDKKDESVPEAPKPDA